MSSVCKEHKKEYEAFCMKPGCRGRDEPMCSICICLHNNQHHSTNSEHISQVVQEDMDRVVNGIVNVQGQLQQIKDYSIKMEEAMKKGDRVRKALEKKLEEMKEYWAGQIKKAAERSSSMMSGNEEMSKEIKRCEHRVKSNIRDPDSIRRRVVELVGQRKYWDAYGVVRQASQRDVDLSDSQLKEKYERLDKELEGYQEQLNEVENAVAREFPAYKALMAENDRLTGRQARVMVGEVRKVREEVESEKGKNRTLEGT